jgi:uncharacterized membrane protein YkvA (DUF1232 family)
MKLARQLKRFGLPEGLQWPDVPVLLWLAVWRRDTPGVTKLLAAVGLLYAISPLDIIPDSIPVIGLLDDILIVTFLLGLAWGLLTPDQRKALLAAVQTTDVPRWLRWFGLAFMLLLWSVVLFGLGYLVYWLIGF